MDPEGFWQFLEQLIAGNALVIDRPKDSHHPRYPDIIYPLDYGYLDGTTSGDRARIDVWVGSSGNLVLSAVILTVDLRKRDSEIKILLGCNEADIHSILAFHNQHAMRAILVQRPKE
jgi:inorganic pyrophosphatase